MKFNQPLKTLFIDPDTPAVEIDEKVDVILSPAFYWVKRVDIPFKSSRDVKKVASTLFEDILPAGEYSYLVRRFDDDYLLFAYDDAMILNALAEKGLPSHLIRHTYFAQSEFDALEQPVRIDQESVLVRQDGIVLKLPSSMVTGSSTMEFRERRSSKERIDLSLYGYITHTKSGPWMIGLLLVLISMFGLEWWSIAQQNKDVKAQMQGVTQSYGLKPTMMQNKAILDSLEASYRDQKRLRELLGSIEVFARKNDQSISRLQLRDNSLRVGFSALKQAQMDQLSKALQAYGKTVRKDNVTVEVQW